ncbi:MAG: hypothetical protein NC238_18020 [Dehalobacter sp.]|nr:hypothetical protein [Dehalobacter sp.]
MPTEARELQLTIQDHGACAGHVQETGNFTLQPGRTALQEQSNKQNGKPIPLLM